MCGVLYTALCGGVTMDNAVIKVISPNFELLGEICDYESLQYTRSFYSVGEFELHISNNKQNADVLVNGNILLLDKAGQKACIIRHRENEIDENGDETETLIIKGPQLKGILTQRLIVPPVSGDGYDSVAGTQEQIMKHYVSAECITPEDANRVMPRLVLAADRGLGVQDRWRFRFDKLSDALEQVGQYAKLGWDVTLDLENEQMYFDVRLPHDRTANQDVLPPALFSTEFGNVKVPHFIQSWIGAATQGYAGGQGDGVNRLIQQVGSSKGLDRMETFLDCSDAESAAELLTLGTQKLAEAAPTQSFEFSVIPDRSMIYGQDYFLGDTVTVWSKKWGITMDAQITQLKEVREEAGTSLEITFGAATPSLRKFIEHKVWRTVR